MTRKTKSDRPHGNFRFRKHDTVGAADALEDERFLNECFVDTGELDILRDTRRPECIILGRTGSGKTALLERLYQKEEKVVQISPESLALTYLSNNEVLKFYMEVGVDMDLFFRMLWRHIFAVEIIRLCLDLTSETRRNGWLNDLKTRVFPRKSREIARDYIIQRSQSFWRETDHNVKEYTRTLEVDLKAATSASLEAAIPGIGKGNIQLGPQIAKKLTTEQKAEITRYGQPVVEKQQMREMSEVIELLGEELLTDDHKRYYLTIDRLDESWVHDSLRYRLIRALFETVKDFNRKLPNVKIIVAIREDLLDRVFRYTRDTGDQEEKYKSLHLRLRWKPRELEQLLDLRVNQIIESHYAKRAFIQARQLLPETKRKQQDYMQYMIDRTLYFPRDIILFFNECIKASEGRPKISLTSLEKAEGAYSEIRLRALAAEWSADYPNLLGVTGFLKKQKQSFKLDEIDQDQFELAMMDFWDRNSAVQDIIFGLVEEKLGRNDVRGLLKELLQIFFRVGIIGIKKESYLETYWSHLGHKVLDAELDENVTYYVHPAFWRVFGINSNSKND